MARVKFEMETRGMYEFDVINRLIRLFPAMRGNLLGYIGKGAIDELKRNHLSGQDLNLREQPTDRRGRRTMNFSIDRRMTRATITSYPVNLFEKGYTLHGRKTAARNIITGKLKTTMSGKLQSIINEWQNTELKRIFDEAES